MDTLYGMLCKLGSLTDDCDVILSGLSSCLIDLIVMLQWTSGVCYWSYFGLYCTVQHCTVVADVVVMLSAAMSHHCLR